MARIEEIAIPESIANDYFAERPFNSLKGVKRLNCFVGPNNSGKSRFLRALFLSSDQTLASTSIESQWKARSATERAIELASENTSDVVSAEEIIALSETGRPGFAKRNRRSQQSQSTNIFDDVISRIQDHKDYRHPHRNREHNQFLNSLFRELETATNLRRTSEFGWNESSYSSERGEIKEVSYRDVYVPTLRGMRLGTEDDDLRFAYFDRTWADYIRPDAATGELKTRDSAREHLQGGIVTGLDIYDTIADKLLGSLEDREFVRRYQDYLSEIFFEGQPVALIPRRDHDTVNIKIGNEYERPLQSLGDGLQQIIILTMPLIEFRDQPLFFWFFA